MSHFVTRALESKLLRLGHRTHSLLDPTPEPVTKGTITGDQWWPERIIKVTRWPSGDVGVTVVDRKARAARLVSPKRQTGTLSCDDAVRGARRARRQLWKACQELNANCLLTIAKRGGFATLDEAWDVTTEVVDMMRNRGWIVGHAKVPEIHDGSRAHGDRHQGANLGTWHMHVATHRPVFFDFHLMHAAVRDIERRLFGNDPDDSTQRMISVNVSRTRPGGKRQTPASIARYLAPYVAKAIDGPRELHRKRFDVSRNRAKAAEITLRCEPAEVSSPEEIANAVLHSLCPGRTFSTPFIVEHHGVRFWQQSAVDWGRGEEPPFAFNLPSPQVLWTLLPKPSHGPPSGSEQPQPPWLARAADAAAEIERFRGKQHLIAKPSRRRTDGSAVGAPPAATAQGDATTSPLTPLADIILPWLDRMNPHPVR